MMSAGLAFARAASHPIMNGVRDLPIATDLNQNQARRRITSAPTRSDLRCQYLAEDDFRRPFFRLAQGLHWRWDFLFKRNHSLHKLRAPGKPITKDISLVR